MEGFWKTVSSFFRRKRGRDAPVLSWIFVICECDALKRSNYEGRQSEDELTCLQGQSKEMGRIWALYEVRVVESINPWASPTQVLI